MTNIIFTPVLTDVGHKIMEHIRPGELKQVWLKASVVGSIWASFEIILGSFLHNLKIPISGTILSFIGVWILISFQLVWKDKGLIWRAGLICALMKSISPSAIILGPMIGIFTESLIIEITTRLLGRNFLAYIIGGALAVLSTLVQKIINLIILYGPDLIKILDNLYRFAVKQIGMEQLNPVYVIAAITALYLLAGMAGATGGFLTGKRYLKLKRLQETEEKITLKPGTELFEKTSEDKYSILFLLLNLFAIIGILLLLNYNLLIIAGIVAVIYSTFCILTYKNSLRRLKKPGFWISFFIITFSASFIWNWFSDGIFFTTEGFLVGLKMNARATVMIIGFASISAELKNPVIKSMLYNRGFASLYQSLNLSFSALPYLISTLTTKEEQGKFPGKKSLHGILSRADNLFNVFENEYRKRPSIVIITGEVHAGKTTYAMKIINALRERNIQACGFLALAVNENGERKGFNLLDLETGEEKELCSTSETPGSLKSGRFYFRRETLEKGLKILTNIPHTCPCVVIDEIGPLELAGGGWSMAIEDLCRKNVSPQIWVVRKPILHQLIRRWNTGDIYIFDIQTDSIKDAVEKVLELSLKQKPAGT
ncbi:MAG TPA: nucleoside-triphosphatase [Bacteroidales bacterium]|nr:nucleoside-triphosphatase [Bacteroidales bacterium]HOK74745.1 nucleoside-triphosphatase [Bacteroidales bacterium]HOM40995.1 nucleoside-triphosphatase [Bacteroidales bacterium]HPP92632.1 nucleoside-triphosphatase [Bacteroidales bacterium]HRR16833.1 nucleoside-triphosphatase [Bacteroidales bacterium]